MQIPFYKYQGTGNDFVIIDQFTDQHLSAKDQEILKHICHRRFGVGADGLILLEASPKNAFNMTYFNADGKEGSLCGNGARCAVACSRDLGKFDRSGRFEAVDGIHTAKIMKNGSIELKMQNLEAVEIGEGYYIMDTGSPHYIAFVEDLDDIDIVDAGRAIRYADRFKDNGINVNFVEVHSDQIIVGTYERGVEDETLSCGTGVTAAALAHALRNELTNSKIKVKTKGGHLSIKFKRNLAGFENIWLCGPAQKVFAGAIEV
ncbi:MAG: diaminopimelate epimerase [Saprospiraceae bacterium]|nr:diaminopimelate epimerase [Saprospiraceae bacterium]